MHKLAAMTGAAFAFGNGQYDNVPLDIRAWFKSVIAPNGVPCCDISDGQRTDYDVRKGNYWVPIEGQWMEGPNAPSSAIAAIRRSGRGVVRAPPQRDHHELLRAGRRSVARAIAPWRRAC